jgi:hypothetical protein
MIAFSYFLRGTSLFLLPLRGVLNAISIELG